MLVLCENCKTKFLVPEKSVAEGDVVQCCVCDHEWKVAGDCNLAPSVPCVIPSSPITKNSSPVRKKENQIPPRSRPILYATGEEKKSVIPSLLTILVIVSLGLAVLRPEITSRMPAAIGMYKTIDKITLSISNEFADITEMVKSSEVTKWLKDSGLFSSRETNIEASIVKATLFNADNRRILSVHGLVHNVSNRDANNVPLNIDLRDDNGQVVKTISFKLKTFLKAGEIETFKIKIPEPPEMASDIQVRISD